MPPSAAQQHEQLLELARERGLRYPIGSKRDFVRQMSATDDPVYFRGRPYESSFAASLIPEFFFPIESEDDLLGKTVELLAARGLLRFSDASRPGAAVPGRGAP